MLTPYEQGDPNNDEGISGPVVDTVTYGIANVIWNVGWRNLSFRGSHSLQRLTMVALISDGNHNTNSGRWNSFL